MPRKRDPETGEPIDVPSSYVDKPPKPRRVGPAGPDRDAVRAAGARGPRADEPTAAPARVKGIPGILRTGAAPSVPPGAGQAGPSPLDAPTGQWPRPSPRPTSPGQAGPSPLDAPTDWIRGGRPKAGERTGDVDPKTRLIRSGRGTEEAAAPGGPGAPEAADPMADPVTGWLVVIAGPGKGRVCRLGSGVNSLGRGEGARVRIDFGDDGISREGHAVLTYDPRGRKYYLQHGGGMNLTYLGDEPVLAPTPLAPMQEISIGATTLRFVPLCGTDFDWQDLEDAGGA